MEHQAHICLSLPFAANVLVQTPPVAIASLASFMFSYSLAFLTPFLHASTLYSFQGNFFLLLPLCTFFLHLRSVRSFLSSMQAFCPIYLTS